MKLFLIIVLMGVVLVAADPGEELQVAARRGQLAEVKRLLDSGAPIETKNQYGATPLYLAVFNGHSDVALLLLEKGANPNVTDTFYKSSILDGALQKDRPEIVRGLIARGVPVSQRQLSMVTGGGSVQVLQAALTAPFKPEELAAALKVALAAKNEAAAAILRKAGASEPKTTNVSAETLASYAGEYVSAVLPVPIRVTLDGETLKAQAEGQGQFALSTESATEFSFAMAGIRMVFDGKSGFILHQGGKEIPFVKKDSSGAPVARKVDQAILASYAGDYSTDQAPIQITVSGTDGQLFMQASGQPRLPLRTDSDSEFSFAPANVRLLFNSKSIFTLHQGGKEFVFRKQESAK